MASENLTNMPVHEEKEVDVKTIEEIEHILTTSVTTSINGSGDILLRCRFL